MRNLRVIHTSFRYWVCVMLTASLAHAASANPPSNKHDAEAVRVCATGQPSVRFNHPSDACWTAFDAALVKRELVAAVNAARMGCKKYARADQCFFVAELAAEPNGLVQTGYMTESRLTLNSIRQALGRIETAEIDDGEVGVLGRALMMHNGTGSTAKTRRVVER